jgi:iron complex outermembrane recepter protein
MTRRASARTALPAFAALLAPAVCGAQLLVAQGPSLAELSLEELGNIKVTTATLRPERQFDVPASIFVITNDDIRRSGANSLPEALRLAPNLEVAQVGASSYAISARGFQNVINNKLLVLLDGRTLYTSVLSGVLWDAQDVMLEDVDRIEVISGPGAALYGANAFSGVINIITRSARDTQGVLAVAGGGNLDRNASVRYGGKLGDDSAYRAYAMHIDRDSLRPEASGVVDRMRKDQVGFRIDTGPHGHSATLEGDAYSATESATGARDVSLSGASLVARVSRDLENGSHLRFRAIYDHSNRDDPTGIRDRLDSFEADLQDDLPAWGAHHVSFAAGYRYALDNTTPSTIIRFIPENRRLHWASLSGQDDIALTRKLSLIVGGKFQTTVYVPPEFMPDVRLAWKLSPRQLLWVSGSRVARTPGRIDRDFFLPANPPFLIKGSPDFQSEVGNVYEIGYRSQPSPYLSFSVSAFYDDLEQLRGGRLAPGGGAFISNEVQGDTTGIEAWAMLQLTERWRMTLGLLELHQDLSAKNGSGDLGGPAGLGNDPRHTVKVRSAYRLSNALDVHVSWRYVSSLSYLTTVPAYQATDIHIVWHVNPKLELSLNGSDLFHSGHVEFDEHGFPSVIPRAGYLQARLAF